MANNLNGSILLTSLIEVKNALVWFQTNFGTDRNLTLDWNSNQFTVSIYMELTDIDDGVEVVQTILSQYSNFISDGHIESN